VFDGTRQNIDLTIRISKDRLAELEHPARARVTAWCDSVSSEADVIVEANRNMRGLVPRCDWTQSTLPVC
jgi:hypothetical protein